MAFHCDLDLRDIPVTAQDVLNAHTFGSELEGYLRMLTYEQLQDAVNGVAGAFIFCEAPDLRMARIKALAVGRRSKQLKGYKVDLAPQAGPGLAAEWTTCYVKCSQVLGIRALGIAPRVGDILRCVDPKPRPRPQPLTLAPAQSLTQPPP